MSADPVVISLPGDTHPNVVGTVVASSVAAQLRTRADTHEQGPIRVEVWLRPAPTAGEIW